MECVGDGTTERRNGVGDETRESGTISSLEEYEISEGMDSVSDADTESVSVLWPS